MSWMALVLAVFAQGWQGSAQVGLSLSQTAYSSAWAGGEEGALAWTFNAEAGLARQLSSRARWDNQFKFQFGQTHTQRESEGRRTWQAPKKAADRIFLESVLRLTLGAVVDPYAAVSWESQCVDVSVPEVKRSLNPMLLTESLGGGRGLLETQRTRLFSRVGFGLRHRVDNEVVRVEPRQTHRRTTTEGGFEWVTDLSHAMGGKATYASKLRVFQALFSDASDQFPEGSPQREFWKKPDVAWEHSLSASLAGILQFTTFVEFLYDKEVDLRGRLRESMGIGIGYRFPKAG